MQDFFDYLGGVLQTGRRNSKSGNTEEYVCYFGVVSKTRKATDRYLTAEKPEI